LKINLSLITGDLIHEGELEDYQARRYYTKAQRILSEFQVPIYLVAGNHDLGGWDDTPPPQGTARRDWWRFFGWPWLNDPPSAEIAYTQDYTFEYGPIKYIGLEAYDNYDGFRYNIYGGESFTSEQMQWLEAELTTSTSESNVLFYHFDFSNQLDLSDLGVEMSLWGHTHQVSGSLTTPPYDLSSGTTSNGTRAYRVLRVEDNVLRPEEVVYADWPLGDNLAITYSSSNDGSNDTLTAVIRNQHFLDFDDARVKFFMPTGDHWYSVIGGELEQVIRSEEGDLCYVSTDLVSSSNQTVTIYVNPDIVGVNEQIPRSWSLEQNFPNPFNPNTLIHFEIPRETDLSLTVFDVSGRRVKTLINGIVQAGSHDLFWDGLDDQNIQVESGIYFYTLDIQGHKQTRKMTLLR